MSSRNGPHRSIFLGNSPLSSTSGPDESVGAINREPSQGEGGGTARPTSNPESLMTTISVGK